MPMSGVSNTRRPGRIEMKVMEMPASEPSNAARGVILRMIGAMKPPAIRTKLWTNTQVSPASQAWIGSLVLSRMGKHDYEGDDEHVRHAGARRKRADICAARLLRQPIGKPSVVDRAEEQHQPERGEDSAEDQRIRHLENVAEEPGQDENVDQDVSAEPEEGVPISGNPPFLRSRLGGHCIRHRAPPSLLPLAY